MRGAVAHRLAVARRERRGAPGRLGGGGLALGLVLLSACKVPIYSVNAEFRLADTSWFAEEDTLFVFYEVSAQQGIDEHSVVEIRFESDLGDVDWTPLSNFDTVHFHVPVDCGVNTLCGSSSIEVNSEPRDVELRMRYHRDSELDLDADTAYNVVRRGAPNQSRSLVVYGVFDEGNHQVQWRSRHQFPALRNEEATELGLRRWFRVDEHRAGTAALASVSNPYGYGATCPEDFTDAGMEPVETVERAVFDASPLPTSLSADPLVCARAMVLDAEGVYATGAIARKNPEVRPAFSALNSPVRDATVLAYFLQPCDREISAVHEEMQRQRLGLGDLAPICVDDVGDAGFTERLIVALTDAVEAERPAGNDMVLVIGVHQDDDRVSEALEEALSAILPEERHRSSPRLAGAFVFDSVAYSLSGSVLGPSTLWCPASTAGATVGDINDASLRACAVAPDDLQIELGPFTFGTLPILPSRDAYLEFIEDFSENQAGEVTSYTIRTPEFSVTSEHTDLGDFGVVTFLDDERINSAPDEAFSYCVTEDPWIIFFRSDLLVSEAVQAILAQACELGQLPEETCALASLGLLPIALLPDWHQQFGEAGYKLGLFWDFPFLLHMEYQAVAAGSVAAFGFSVPFGLAADGEQYLGGALWTMDQFAVDKQLTQCTRFCDHPTFDSAGVYHVTDSFTATYGSTCYRPSYPETADGGFPLDP